MKYKKFFRLILWELEETWRLPTPELIAGIAIFFGLSAPASLGMTSYMDLRLTMSKLFLYLMFIIAVLFARSIAGCLEKKEILTFFTYPVRRATVLFSKFLINLILTFIIFGSILIARALLMNTEPWNIAVLIALFTLFVQTLFLSTFSLIVSLITKRTWAAVLLVIVSLFAIPTALQQLKPPLKYLLPTLGADVTFDCLAKGFMQYTIEDFSVALGFPVIASIIFLLASLIYFKRMQVD